MSGLVSSTALVAGWTLARPWGLAGLGLALLVLLASLLRRDASSQEPRPLGTARFLDDAEGEAERGARLRLPPSRLLAIVALALGAIALSGPLPPEPDEPPLRLLALVDRSPSMHLPADPAAPAGPTRLEAAAAALADAVREEWTGALGGDIRLEWRAVERGAPPVGAPEVPAALAEAPAVPHGEPRWAALDRAGAVWVTDRAPEVSPARAGLSASGGGAVPGALGWSPAGPLVETADGALEVRPGAAPAPSAHVAAGVDREVGGVVAAWAADRGVELSPGAAGAGLVVVPPSSDPGQARGRRVAGAGWSAPATRARTGTPWRVTPGRLRLGFDALEAPPTDPVAFASELADALDAALLLPPDYVSREERRSAGAPSLIAPRATLDAESASARRSARVIRARRARAAAGVAALAAAALALAAGLLRLVGR